MQTIGETRYGYKVVALDAGEASPMQNHKGGEIAVDEQGKVMYAWGVFVALYGTGSIMEAAEKYKAGK
jgi:hypothetical protein